MALNKITVMKTIFEAYFKLPQIVENLDKTIVRKSCINYNLFKIENEFDKIYNLIVKKSNVINVAKLAESTFEYLNRYEHGLLRRYFADKIPAKQIAKLDCTSWRTIVRRIDSICNRSYKKLLKSGCDFEYVEKIIKSEMWLSSIYNDQMEVVYGKIDSLEKGSES